MDVAIASIGVILASDPQLPDAVEAYLAVVRAMNPDGELRYYPGSPELARLLSRMLVVNAPELGRAPEAEAQA